MELAVVSGYGKPPARHVHLLAERLSSQSWAEVHSDVACSWTGGVLADLMDVELIQRGHLDPGWIMANRPGQGVVVTCAAPVARSLVASVIDVPLTAIPLPAELSLTWIRASRKGIRNLVCFNDTLHLTDWWPNRTRDVVSEGADRT